MCKRYLASFSFEIPSLSYTKCCSISFVLALFLKRAIEIRGTESQGSFLCHVFELFFIGWVHRPHEIQRTFLIFAEYSVTTFKTG